MQQKQQHPTVIFSACAPSDIPYLEQWEAHLHLLELAGILSVWSARHLQPGIDRLKLLHDHLDHADFIVLLLSADFFTDQECITLLERALVRHQQGAVRVIPLLLRPVAWHETKLGTFTPLPSNGSHVTQWHDPEAAFDDCVRNLRLMLGRPVITPLTRQQEWVSVEEQNRERMREGSGTTEIQSPERVSARRRVSTRFSRSRLYLLCTIIIVLGVIGTSIIYSVTHPPQTPPPPSISKTYPPSSAKLVLNDPLQDNSHGYNWDERSNSCEFSEDGYHVRTAVSNYTFYCNAFATDFANVAYEVQMSILQGDSGGLVFRANADDSTFYDFSIAQDGHYSLIIYTGHTTRAILDHGNASGFHTGLHQSNLLAVVANSNRIDLFVNHQYATDVIDDTYPHGQIGVAASTGQGGAVEVVFSNAKLWKL